MKVRLGMEASGHARWLERLFSELRFELWVGDAYVQKALDGADIVRDVSTGTHSLRTKGKTKTAICRDYFRVADHTPVVMSGSNLALRAA